MSICINAYMAPNAELTFDHEGVLARLNRSVPDLRRIRDFWTLQGVRDDVPQWTIEPKGLRLPHLRKYTAPGCLWFTLGPSAARINTLARWGGFVTNPEVREAHLSAFRAVARALCCEQVAICAENVDQAGDRFLAGGTMTECMQELTEVLGPPRDASAAAFSSVNLYDPTSTRFWIIEAVRPPTNHALERTGRAERSR